MDNKATYSILFNAITDEIEKLEKDKIEIEKRIQILKDAHCTAEEIYMDEVNNN